VKPSSAKNKGRILQQKVRDMMLKAAPELEPDDCRSTSMGAGGEDIQLSPAARKIYPINPECKNLAKIAVFTYYGQAAQHGQHEPVVFLKQNFSKVLALVDAEYLIGLQAELWRLKNPEGGT
jgi:hypothetical protein